MPKREKVSFFDRLRDLDDEERKERIVEDVVGEGFVAGDVPEVPSETLVSESALVSEFTSHAEGLPAHQHYHGPKAGRFILLVHEHKHAAMNTMFDQPEGTSTCDFKSVQMPRHPGGFGSSASTAGILLIIGFSLSAP